MTRLQAVHLAHRRSLWLEEALAAEPGAEQVEPLTGSHRADVCVVGGGYTGLWTALRIKELDPSVDVMLLEADICGGGASGRNGGFATGWWGKIDGLAKLCGEQEAVRLARAVSDAVTDIGAFCYRHGVDAHFCHAGAIWAATTPLHLGIWEKGIRSLEKRGITDVYQRLAPEEVAARTGSPVHLAGVLDKTGGTVQPALLARGLRRVAIEQGVRVFERTPVTRLDRGAPPVVRTSRAAVAADKVVLAINAWGAALPELRRYLLPMSSDMVATAPIPERLKAIGWTGGEAVSDTRLMLHYYRTTRDGRIAIGRAGEYHAYLGHVTPTFDGDHRRAELVTRGLRRLYPMLADVPITHEWSGAVDRAENGTLFCGRLGGDPHVHYAVGYSGNGVAPSLIGARILASSVLGRRDEWSATPLDRGPVSHFPPEPARYFGGLVVRAAVKRQEEMEETGVPAGAWTRRLAALAPSGMQKGKHVDGQARASRQTAGGRR